MYTWCLLPYVATLYCSFFVPNMLSMKRNIRKYISGQFIDKIPRHMYPRLTAQYLSSSDFQNNGENCQEEVVYIRLKLWPKKDQFWPTYHNLDQMRWYSYMMLSLWCQDQGHNWDMLQTAYKFEDVMCEDQYQKAFMEFRWWRLAR